MGIPNMFVLAQATLYILIFVLSFFICIPSGINVTDFNGHCLLNANGYWMDESPQRVMFFINNWGPDSACNFTIFIGVMSLVLSLFYSIWTAILLARGIESSWLYVFINLLVNCIMAVCLFSDGLTVSIGFREWCKLITDPRSKIEDCESGQYLNIFTNLNIKNGSNYYTQWQVTQFGLWSCWIVWLVLSIMSLARLYQFHRQEAFSVSINRERQRLIQKVGARSGYDQV